MSQRVKRPNRSDDGSVPVKRRKRPATAQEEEEATSLASWKPINDLKIYNRTTTEAPAELFRKDLISAMKLPDSEPLASDEYWIIVDQWKQEWERGVQVPVNPDSLPEPSVTVTHCAPVHNIKPVQDFKPTLWVTRIADIFEESNTNILQNRTINWPKTKYIRITKDDNFNSEDHVLSKAPAQAEAACSYDLDECDVAWLKLVNSERLAAGLSPVTEDQLERVIERLELRCWDKIQAILRNEEGLGIEYDENVICDVCRSPDSEEGNEMVFCDSCNICVHQACYGITRIPEGQWLCCTCTISQRPDCVLCPNKGGAMKCTRLGQEWAHVSCALWIPEVSIGCVEKMEPITKISSIPQSRWALICVLCRERVGACIQCSVKTCKTAYHVTCAFKHGLEMRAIIEDENADDGVKLRSYCEKHSKSSKKEKSVCSGSEDDDCKRKKRKDMTSEEKNQARAARSQEIEGEFYKHVNVKDIAVHIDVDSDALQYIYNYWKLKRKAGHNKPLLPPKSEDIDMLSHKQEQADLEKMKMFVQLRQDLERVRNLCYMVSRREKLSRSFFRMREQTFHKQASVLQDCSAALTTTVVQAVIEANHGPSIYDKLYSHSDAEDHTRTFETILARIAGIKSPPHDSSDEKKPEINGLFKDVKNNPYKKLYFNGSSKRRSGSLYGSSLSSASSSDEKPKDNKENRLHSSTEDEKPFNKKKVSPSKSAKLIDRRKKRHSITRSKLDSSSEDDIKPHKKDWQLTTSRLKQMESQLGVSASDSDELMPIKPTTQMKKAISSIYSDSDSSDVSMKNDTASDTQSQSRLRTKAAVKEFSNKPSTSKSPNKSSPENKKKTKEEPSPKKDKKKKDYVPSDLIVPQRQAAKKATENLKSTTGGRVNKEQPAVVALDVDIKSPAEKEEKPVEKPIAKPKPKIGRPPKENKDENKSKPEKIDKKEAKKEDVFDIDKEFDKVDLDILAYVPQRQAAKKAAEHIKSNMGKPAPADTPATDDKKEAKKDVVVEEKTKKEAVKRDADTKTTRDVKEVESKSKVPEIKPKEAVKTPENKSKEPTKISEHKHKVPKEIVKAAESKSAKISENKRKSTSNSSTSSSSSSSSDTSSSSSSDSEDDRPTKKPQSESLFSPREQTKRTGSKDWPFLDKAAKSTASTSSSDSSDSSRPSSPQPKAIEQKETVKPAKQNARSAPNKPSRKSTDKKSVSPKREEQSVRAPRGKGRTSRGRSRATANTGDRIGDANVRSGNLVERSSVEREQPTAGKVRKGKSDYESEEKETASKPADKSLSPVPKENKVVAVEEPKSPELGDLEKEILERKAASNKTNTKPEKLSKSPEKIHKSPIKEVKENKEPPQKHASPKKAPVKTKSIEDIFANKLSNTFAKSPEQKLQSKQYTNAQDESNNIRLDIFNVDIDNNKEEDIIKNSPKNTQSRSIFSPHPHGKEDILVDIDNILDDGFGISKDEEIIKVPLTFSISNSILFKEDSKEDSARETLNLVEKLRMGLSKKSTGYDIDDAVSVASSTKNDSDRLDFTEQIVPNNIIDSLVKDDLKEQEQTQQMNLEMRVDVSNVKYDDAKEYEHYSNCEPSIQLDVNKSVPEIQQQHLDVAAPADERWVPPSETYSNLQAVDAKIFNEHVPDLIPPYMQQYEAHMPTHIDNRLQDDKHESPSQDRRITQTPFLDPASMDCISSPAPYADMHPQAKWADSQVMPTRRSSSSSIVSTVSNSSRRNDVEDEMLKRQDVIMMNHPNMDVMPFGVLPQNISYPPSSLDAFPPFSEASQFVSTPVSLFPPTNINTQIPFPSPGAAMFPPPFGASFPTPHSVIPPLPKPMDEAMHFPPTACTAAFTSSQHNMALTAAMVNLPPIQPTPTTPILPTETIEEKPLEMPIQSALIEAPPAPVQETPQPVHVEEPPLPSPALSNSTPNHVEPSPNPSLKSNTSSVGKKSPSKPTRTSSRFISQQHKSPSKSPAKSPRQELSKSGTGRGRDNKKGKSGSGRGSQSQSRGRGRGRGRGRTTHTHDFDYANVNTIHNKLVGTVYDLDFDDDMNEMGDLRTMRERRKSIDVHERKIEPLHISRDSSESPKFTSPTHKNRSYNTDLSELRPPTPIREEPVKPPTPEPPVVEEPKQFPSIVQPVLPGPVDMRTYNSTFDAQQLLGAFGTGVAEQPAHEELDEYFEKELHSALTASLKKPEAPQVPEVSNIKVSLSDSRNQLKVKIKGPIANYTSTVAPLPPASDTAVPSIPTISISNNVITNISSSLNSGTSSNLRRMRKKELLHQYCSQDMNMGEPTIAGSFTATPVTPSINRTIITIPKAVASMTSIPTKDDYRDYRTGADDLYETKARKEKPARPALSRELKQLDITLDDDTLMERRRSIGSNNSGTGVDASNKRRGRPPRPSQTATQPQTTPKLKIKISGNSIVGGTKIDDKKDRIRPPKKRLSATVVKPSVEDLKRESMKFRKQVMADFGVEKKEKKKKDKSNKKSKKKKKQEVQIIANDGVNAPKLIIRFGKKADSDRTSSADVSVAKPNEVKQNVEDVSNKDRDRTECGSAVEQDSASTLALRMVRTNKVTPIKLKLSRCQEGSGYVMKTPPPEEDKPPPVPPPPLPNSTTSIPATLNLPEPPPPVHTATPLPLNKDCEVR